MISFDADGRRKFNQATARLIGQSISVYLDDEKLWEGGDMSEVDKNQVVIHELADSEGLAAIINANLIPFELAEAFSAD